jgi:uncharacterized protein GlcG (DUF336 family)
LRRPAVTTKSQTGVILLISVGKIVWAIGASGGTTPQDGQVAKAGAEAATAK